MIYIFSVSSRITSCAVNFTVFLFCFNFSRYLYMLFDVGGKSYVVPTIPLFALSLPYGFLSLDDDVALFGEAKKSRGGRRREKNLFLRSQIDTKAHYLDSFL